MARGTAIAASAPPAGGRWCAGHGPARSRPHRRPEEFLRVGDDELRLVDRNGREIVWAAPIRFTAFRRLPPVTLVEGDSGQTVEVDRGQRVFVALGANRTTGHEWTLENSGGPLIRLGDPVYALFRLPEWVAPCDRPDRRGESRTAGILQRPFMTRRSIGTESHEDALAAVDSTVCPSRLPRASPEAAPKRGKANGEPPRRSHVRSGRPGAALVPTRRKIPQGVDAAEIELDRVPAHHRPPAGGADAAIAVPRAHVRFHELVMRGRRGLLGRRGAARSECPRSRRREDAGEVRSATRRS